jgi:hypothetical protein
MNIQIEQAAHGMVSGTLAEWPMLKWALFEEYDILLPDETPARTVRNICRLVLGLPRIMPKK